MAKTPEYTRRATANYQAKYDLIQVRFPKGTKERIKEVAANQSVNDYIVNAIIEKLDKN